MKASPRPRKAPAVPKATAPDPALVGATTTATASNTGSAGVPGNASAATPPARRNDGREAAETVKITVRVPAAIADRARGAYRLALATAIDPPSSFSAWVAGVIADAATAAEAAGGPLAPTPAGVLPTGRPTGR